MMTSNLAPVGASTHLHPIHLIRPDAPDQLPVLLKKAMESNLITFQILW